jgi:hypothetical protein
MEAVPANLIVRGEMLRPEAGDRLESGPDSRFMLDEHASANTGDLSPARQMMQDFRRGGRVPQPAPSPWTFELPSRKDRGAFGLFDLGEEQFGELELEVEAPAGTVLDLSHGEHLEDLGVRAFVGGRHFADRFVCGAGLNHFSIPFRRLGARFLQVHILFPKRNVKPVVIRKLGIVAREYAGPERGRFVSADRLLAATRNVAVRTLRLSMSEHFMDCPWREQGLYAYDSCHSALFNYYTFGDYDFPEESLGLLARGLRDDGLLELCAPARVPVTVPVFSLDWISGVRDHYLFSGRAGLFREVEPIIHRILDAFLQRADQDTGLFRLFDGDPYWAFYEWAPGLDFKNGHSFGDDGKFRLDAPHNIYLIKAFDALADLLGYEGRSSEEVRWRRQAAVLRRAVRTFYWDEKHKLFASFGDRRRRWHYSASVQALAIITGVANTRQRRLLQPRLFAPDNSLVPMTFSTSIYGYQALMTAPAALQANAYDMLIKTYGEMILRGATTLWETAGGADEFDLGGSLCHGWSAVPLWFGPAFVLGVEPVAPGFRRFRVQPRPAGLPAARGSVPTPRGPIEVAWQLQGGRLDVEVKAPSGLSRV